MAKDTEKKFTMADFAKKINKEYNHLPIQVFGPFEAQVYKLNEKYRMRMVVKCRLNKETRALFSSILTEFAKAGQVSLTVDLNPLSV